MELTDSVMCDLHLDVHLDLNDSFSFGPRDTGSFSSNSISSSCTSPDYGPFTPTSGRSTSPRSSSMDFGACFDSYNSLSFDLTPPSSAVSTSFSMGSSFSSDGSDLLLSDLPVTSTRSRLNTGFPHLPLGDCDSQIHVTPSSAIPMHSFADTPLGSTFHSTPGYGNNWNVSSMWPESPGNSELFPVPSKCQGRGRSLNGAKNSSRALQREQGKIPAKGKAAQKPSKGGPIKEELFDSRRGIVYTITDSKGFICGFPGCEKTYKRVEHVKRHMRSGHTDRKIFCAWCSHDANREDNFSCHLKKHLEAESKNPRVPVITDPVERAKIEKMISAMNTRRKREETEPRYKARSKSETTSEFEFNPKDELYKTEFKFKDEAA